MSFDTLGLSAELVRAVSEKGYSQPTPIQKKAIPVILEGRDILAGAQTGTGKTAGFTLPMLQQLAQRKGQQSQAQSGPRALVLAPTRELAAQVNESVIAYSRYVNLKSAVVFGGVNINPQIKALRKGVDIVVATPGRLLDHVNQRTVNLSNIEIVVLDEADRMLDMGFINDIRKILSHCPKQRQNLLFSATYSKEIRELSQKLLQNPVLIEVAKQNIAAQNVQHLIHPVDRERKRELLSSLIGSENWRQVLVFTRTKHGADKLAKQLGQDGLHSAAIHGNKSQGARTRALADFKSGKVRVLVATDIAARGLDIDQLPHVVNFELPNIAEDYVHRIGRTGRAGNEGTAISLVCIDEHKLLFDIEKLLKRDIPKVTLPGYEPDPTIRAEPVRKGQQAKAANNHRNRRNKKPGNPHAGRPPQHGKSNGNKRAHQAAR